MEGSGRGTSKFTCYFCNKTIENETEMGHTAMCGNVLIPCPNKCGAYIPRMELKKHKRECLNRITRSMPRLPSLDENLAFETRSPPTNTSSLDRNLPSNHSKGSDLKINDVITQLSRKLDDFERRYYQLQQNPQSDNLRQNYDGLRNGHMQQSLEIEKMKYQNKLILDWRNKVETQLNSLKHAITLIQNSKKETDLHWAHLQDKLLLVEKIQMDINYIKDLCFKESTYCRQSNMAFEQDINRLKDYFNEENARAATAFNEQTIAMDILKRDIEDIKILLAEQKSKFTNIVFDLRAASQIASEATERIEIQEREFSDMKKEINQIKLDLEILEGLSSSSDNETSSGRLIWKVTEVDAKMQRAKDLDSVLKSPVFYTHQYGYKIRVLMYLNGLKKWKGRYALLCIHVLKGEYDMLLKWPCHIEGTITLRDLEHIEAVKPFSKFISAKRQCGDEESEEPQESSSSYIFIPHSTLLKSNHVKEDIIFIDVKIQQNSKLETSL